MQYLLNGVAAGAEYLFVAVSFSLIYSTAGFFHFAHAGVYLAGAYLFLVFNVILGFSLWFAVALSLAGCGCLGAVMEIFVYRPARRRGASSVLLLLASLGMFIIVQNSVSLVFGDEVQRLGELRLSDTFEILGGRLTAPEVLTIAVAFGLFALVGGALRFSRLGKEARALASDGELARATGINTDRVRLTVFVVGSMIAALGSILVGFDREIDPQIGFTALLFGVVGAVIGGVGSVWGSGAGAVLLGLTQNLSAIVLSTVWQNTIVFLVLVVFLLFRPQGLFGEA